MSSGRPDSTPSPPPIASTTAWNGVTSPSSSAAAQTDTAVPPSTSRDSAITPPAPQPTVASGSSASCRPSSVASGAARCAPDANTIARSHGRPPSPACAVAAASVAPARGSGCRGEPGADADAHALMTLPAHPRCHPARVPAATIVALFGPTGVGKTAVAVALAARLRAEGDDPVAVSADALQLYRGLEILTGAPSAAERAALEHRLVGVLPVGARASAGAYARRAHAEIDALLAAGRRPIVVGGTGLYLRAALADLDLRPPPPPGVRERWTALLEREGATALHDRLAARDPVAAGAIPAADARRVVRALELLDAGAAPPRPGGDQLWSPEMRHPTLLVALTMDRAPLYARIDARVEAMVASGAAEEARAALAAGASPGARQALGFDELLRGDVAAMRTRTRRYAKRQLTWLRKLPASLTLDVTGRAPAEVAADIHAALAARA